jgi:hypothetical protein
MKTRSGKSALTNNRKRSIISSLNRHMRMKRTQGIKMSRIMCRVKRSSRIKDPRWLSTWQWKLRRLGGGRRDFGWIGRGDTTLQMIHPPGELKDSLWRLLRRTTGTSWGAQATLPVGGASPTLLNLVSLGLAVAVKDSGINATFGWIGRGDTTLQTIHPPGELKDAL